MAIHSILATGDRKLPRSIAGDLIQSSFAYVAVSATFSRTCYQPH
ncbi:hypothetical protein RBSH_05254 [Rhodopirellula baltica SH28]|uniref:Uncharacterized protein n=1 Tax=Rhodopirellula baltica SH28 TaxID=993517 RepID=K5C8W2_RHOBT|nr:hypothetical protein RBSH_05254 [Rhodopirellula baltica SH28]